MRALANFGVVGTVVGNVMRSTFGWTCKKRECEFWIVNMVRNTGTQACFAVQHGAKKTNLRYACQI